MNQYKPLLLFLLRFLGSYIVMLLIYNWYLSLYLPNGTPDPFTRWNSDVASKIFNLIGYKSESIHAGKENYMRLAVDGKFASIVNEGCNAVSVLIIYISFIFAFYTKFKQVLIYLAASLIGLIIMNVFRIVFLTYIYRFLPEYSKIGHDYLFPAIIYGSIVILWIIWIKFFVFKKNKNAE